VPLEVRSEVVGGLADLGADDERQPGVLDRVQALRREHAGVGHHDQIGAWWRSRKASRTGSRVLVSAVLPSKQCTSSGNPEGVDE
jgi:hypothetical protein